MYKKVSIKGHLNRLHDPDIIDIMFLSSYKNSIISGDLETRYKAYAKRRTEEKRAKSLDVHKSYIPTVLKSEIERTNDLIVHKCNKLESYCGKSELIIDDSLDVNLSDELRDDLLDGLIRISGFNRIINMNDHDMFIGFRERKPLGL